MSTSHDQHYAPGDSEAIVAAALRGQQHDVGTFNPDAFAALDQFHTGGIVFTRTLAQHAALTAADRVLDVGGGLGGPARLLAEEWGCQVTVLELTDAYCRLGEQLTAQVHLSNQVRFQHGDALAMPFADGSYDVVWTQHRTMNIADKAHLYTQIHRVLRPGGRLAFQEVVAGSGEAVHLPTMWAHTEAMNFLQFPASLRATLLALGFQEQQWDDITPLAAVAMSKSPLPSLPQTGLVAQPIGLPMLLGADGGTMLRNHLRNLQEGRIRIIEGVFVRS